MRSNLTDKLCCFRFCSKNDTDSVDLDYYGKAKLADEELSTPNNSESEISRIESPPPSHLGKKKSKHAKEKGSASVTRNRNVNKIPNHESGKAKKISKTVGIEKPHTTENSSKTMRRNSSVISTSFLKKGYISTQKSRKSKKGEV